MFDINHLRADCVGAPGIHLVSGRQLRAMDAKIAAGAIPGGESA